MMMLADMGDPGLVVFPTHRLVRDLPDFSEESLLAACGEYFEVSPQPGQAESQAALDRLYREDRHAFALYAGAGWTVLTLKDPAVMDRLLPEKSQAYLDRVALKRYQFLERDDGSLL